MKNQQLVGLFVVGVAEQSAVGRCGNVWRIEGIKPADDKAHNKERFASLVLCGVEGTRGTPEDANASIVGATMLLPRWELDGMLLDESSEYAMCYPPRAYVGKPNNGGLEAIAVPSVTL